LWVIVVSLGLNLVAEVFLEDIWLLTASLLLLLQGCHHVWAGVEVGIVPALELLQLILPGGHDGLLWICRADVVILVSFRARDSIGGTSHCFLLRVVHHGHGLVVHRELGGLLASLSVHLVVGSIHDFLAGVEGNLNAPICISY
tara:strand:- start:842 stop:1273 length:432 start_codon:yes stop_codon:yes gene_type:complete